MLIENEKNMLLRNWIVCFQVSPTRADFTRGCPIGPGLRGRRTPAAADADGGSASSSNTSSISSSSCHDMAAYAIRPFMSPKDSDGFTLDQGWLATACSSDQCWNNKLFFLMVHISFSSNTWYRYIYMYLFNKYSKKYTYSIYLSSLSIYLSESKFIYIYTYLFTCWKSPQRVDIYGLTFQLIHFPWFPIQTTVPLHNVTPYNGCKFGPHRTEQHAPHPTARESMPSWSTPKKILKWWDTVCLFIYIYLEMIKHECIFIACDGTILRFHMVQWEC